MTGDAERSRRFGVAISLILAAVLAAGPALGDDRNPLVDKWEIDLGGFLSSSSTVARFDALGITGTRVSFEDDLGLSDTENLFRGSVGYRFGKRHRLQLGYFDLDRSGGTTLTAEITIDGRVFPLSADVETRFGSEFIELGYSYYFYVTPKTAASATFGLSLLDLRVGVALASLPQLGADLEIDTAAPIPLFGLEVRQKLPQKFVFLAAAGFLTFTFEDFDGTVYALTASIEHRTWEHFGFGLRLAVQDYDVEEDAQIFDRRYEFEVSGIHLYGRLAF